MRRRVFADTSALVALYDPRDQNHLAAKVEYNELNAAGTVLIATTDVFGETVTLLQARAGHAAAVAAGVMLRSETNWRLFPVEDSAREAAWEMFCKFDDKRYSLTDCTSFVTMQRMRIQEALTFDSDFRKMGFTILPH